MIKVDTLSKGFVARGGGKSSTYMTVLDRVSFDVKEGVLVSLIGASGCGKTTLLRIIAGLTPADGGSVSVRGVPISGPRRDLCMVFQNFGLLPWRSVLSNVAFPLELDGMSRVQREEIAQHYLERVGLKGFERHYPHELSGGMQQRVGIARALTRQPLVLLMDEPFAALDAQTRENLQEDFLGIWKELRTTVIFVTHSIDEALLLSDQIIVLRAKPGRIKRMIAAPFGDNRTVEAVRSHPLFSQYGREIRDLLREDDTA